MNPYNKGYPSNPYAGRIACRGVPTSFTTGNRGQQFSRGPVCLARGVQNQNKPQPTNGSFQSPPANIQRQSPMRPALIPGSPNSSRNPMSPNQQPVFSSPRKFDSDKINPDKPTELANFLKTMLDDKWKDVQSKPETVNFVWTLREGFDFAELITKFLPMALETLRQEPYPLLKLKSPLLVLGDLHGAFDDLNFFFKECYDEGVENKESQKTIKSLRIASNVICLGEDGEVEMTMIDQVPEAFSKSMKNFHRQKSVFKGEAIAPKTDTFLFLGDYVDRGLASVEVIVYLLAMKVSHPDKIYLLRGNHETEDMNELYGFRESCLSVFGIEAGKRLWKEFNRLFMYFPLAAIVDDRIFCAHGGIPRLGFNGEEDRMAILTQTNWLDVRSGDLKAMMESSKRQYEMLIDLIWADPHDPETDEAVDENGFGESYRGEGCTYAMKAVDTFLKHYNFEMIFRAHQPKASGFHVAKGGKVVTIFSSSHYKEEEDNAAGGAYVDGNTVRAITRSW